MKKATELNLSYDLFADYERLLEHPQVDIGSIYTPPDLHTAETIAAAEAGKHLPSAPAASIPWAVTN